MKYSTHFVAAGFCALALIISVEYIPLNTDVSAQQDNNPKDRKDNQPRIRQDNQPKIKFRKQSESVPGQYLVYFTDDIKMEDIERVADELIAKYGGSIYMENEILEDTKQADGSIKREVVRPGRKAIYKKKSRKGFHGVMTEEQAKSLSEDPRVDYVTEIGVSKIGVAVSCRLTWSAQYKPTSIFLPEFPSPFNQSSFILARPSPATLATVQ